MKARRATQDEPSSLAEMTARKRAADLRQAEAARRLERKDAKAAEPSQNAGQAELTPGAPSLEAGATPNFLVTQAVEIRKALGEEAVDRTPRRIIARVAAEFGMTAQDITGENRDANVVRARFAAIAAVRQAHPRRSLPWLGRQFGGRDHTTMLHALRELGLVDGPAPNPILSGIKAGPDGMRPVGPLTLPDLVSSTAPGAAPQFRMVPPTKLLIDSSYQRGLSDQSLKLIRRIVSEWSWSAFKPPIVVEVARGYHVIDGQHTAIAAATHPHIAEIPVMVVVAERKEDRAQAFVRHNRDRVRITGMQLHASLVTAGDPTALGVEEACQAAGAKVLRTAPANSRYAVGETMAIEALNKIVRRHGVATATAIVRTCVQGGLAPVAAAPLRAVESLLTNALHAGSYEPDTIARTFRDMGIQLDRKATVFAATHKVAYWQGLVATLAQNTRRRRGSVDEVSR